MFSLASDLCMCLIGASNILTCFVVNYLTFWMSSVDRSLLKANKPNYNGNLVTTIEGALVAWIGIITMDWHRQNFHFRHWSLVLLARLLMKPLKWGLQYLSFAHNTVAHHNQTLILWFLYPNSFFPFFLFPFLKYETY